MLCVTDAWQKAYPGACLGLMLVRKVNNAAACTALEHRKGELEIQLRTGFSSKEELKKFYPVPVYSEYYKRFKKTYHVLPQLESVIFKDKKIPSVSPVVEAMFMAELKNGLLTAGHDYDKLQLPLTLDVTDGDETYLLINGKEQVVKAQDMAIADVQGLISSIVYGPDWRTRIVPETKNAVFIIYAPPGIPENLVRNHLSDIYAYVKIASPDAAVEFQQIYQA